MLTLGIAKAKYGFGVNCEITSHKKYNPATFSKLALQCENDQKYCVHIDGFELMYVHYFQKPDFVCSYY